MTAEKAAAKDLPKWVEAQYLGGEIVDISSSGISAHGELAQSWINLTVQSADRTCFDVSLKIDPSYLHELSEWLQQMAYARRKITRWEVPELGHVGAVEFDNEFSKYLDARIEEAPT